MVGSLPRGMPVMMSDPREKVLPFPMVLLLPHAAQAMHNHGQTLARLAERGGLAPSEILAILEDREWEHVDDFEGLRRLGDYMTSVAEGLINGDG